ncbi:MAG TPA: helix-turn-helix domain-containing protein [Ktedonobacteraceae bacterium]
MTEQTSPLTALSEAKRTQAYARFAFLRPALEEGVSQAQIVRTHQMALSTVQRWIKRYREQRLARLAHAARSDRGKRRGLALDVVKLIEGLALLSTLTDLDF